MRKLLAMTGAGLFLATASVALCADIVGRVSDLNDAPMQGVQIVVKDAGSKTLAKVATDGHGRYQITGLTPGSYDYVLDPLGTSFKGGTAAAYLDDKGLTINWKVSASNPAVALATEGTGNAFVAGDPFGLSSKAFTAAVASGVGLVAGGVIGGYAAAGGFSGPSSPSM
jgi:Carboxypeptidase regulatory-like domain